VSSTPLGTWIQVLGSRLLLPSKVLEPSRVTCMSI
jgi:hypothetical protein